MSAPFPGFPPQARQFLRELRENNRRDWFQPRKADYLRFVRAPLVELGEVVGASLARHSPRHVFDSRRCVYRIYRDVRFAKNKDPYKTHAAVIFPPDGAARHEAAGFYFHFSADELLVGGGLYAPTSGGLRQVRQRIVEEAGQLRAILAERSFRRRFGSLQGQRLKRGPLGFPRDHPAADLLLHKQFLAGATLDAGEIERSTIAPLINEHFRALAPLLAYINRALGVG